MKEKIQLSWPLIISLVVLWLTTSLVLTSTFPFTHGHLIYALDDAYIHMAMAKNLAQHGVYGITSNEFSSSSSSPLWTVLLAVVYVISGVHEWTPFILNLLIASGILVIVFTLLRAVSQNNIFTFITLLAIIFYTPFPAMIFVGMEHLLHILLMILFVWFVGRTIAQHEFPTTRPGFVVLVLLSTGVTMVRFESYALVFFSCLLFLMRKKWKESVCLILSAIVPLGVYQFISVSRGWFWLPNSILLRSDSSASEVFNSQQAIVVNPLFHSGSRGLFSTGIDNFFYTSQVSVLVVASCVLLIIGWIVTKSFWKTSHVSILLFIIIALAHLQFGKIGHFFRYEAYLVAVGIFVIVWSMMEILKERKNESDALRRILGVGMILIFCAIQIPLQVRGKESLRFIPLACRNIYEQQYHMGLFLRRFYPESSIAVNDIGAVSFLGDVRLLDLVGLASADVLKLKTAGQFTTEKIQLLCESKNVAIAIVYDSWFKLEGLRGVPSTWKKIGEWKISYNIICGGDVVSFYAVQPSEEENLIHTLQRFSLTLPPSVQQSGRYFEEKSSPSL